MFVRACGETVGLHMMSQAEHLCCFPVEAEAQLQGRVQELGIALLPCTKEVRTDQRSPPDFSSVDSLHCF